MGIEYIKIGLDVFILTGLGVFIYFAMQLSRALNAFRAHRNEFDGVMKDLASHIDNAQVAVNELKQTSQESGDELHKLVRDAQFLADELQQMNAVSESLAARLEQAVNRSRKTLEIPSEGLGANVSPISKKRKNDSEFIIRDPDFTQEDDKLETEEDTLDSDPDFDGLSSQAEKELLKALKRGKK